MNVTSLINFKIPVIEIAMHIDYNIRHFMKVTFLTMNMTKKSAD